MIPYHTYIGTVPAACETAPVRCSAQFGYFLAIFPTLVINNAHLGTHKQHEQPLRRLRRAGPAKDARNNTSARRTPAVTAPSRFEGDKRREALPHRFERPSGDLRVNG